LENDSFLKIKNADNETIDFEVNEKPVIYDSEQKAISDFNCDEK
jgi:hypothetical protein